MNVTLTLNPDVEEGLTARAHERGVSLDAYLHELVAREAGLARTGTVLAAAANDEQFDNLSDLLLNSPFSEAALDLERSKDYPREVKLG